MSETMASAWRVFGGEYKDPMTMANLIGEYVEYGPFDTYCDAYKVWNEHMRKNIDNYHYRLRIEQQ